MRKPAFCICENKDADQLRGNREADHCLCFRYTGSTIPLSRGTKVGDMRILAPERYTAGLCMVTKVIPWCI